MKSPKFKNRPCGAIWASGGPAGQNENILVGGGAAPEKNNNKKNRKRFPDRMVVKLGSESVWFKS